MFTNSVDFVLLMPSLDKLPTPSIQLTHIDINSKDVFEAILSLNMSKAGGCDGISPHFLKLCATSLLTPTINLLSLSVWLNVVFRENGRCPKFLQFLMVEMFIVLTTTGQFLYYAFFLRFLNQLFFMKLLTLLGLIFPPRNMLSFKVNPVYLNFCTLTLRFFVHLIMDHLATSFSLTSRKHLTLFPMHQELWYKLWSFGITGPLWLWFKDYLSNRSHRVSINGTSSSCLPVLSGVPQGSVLSPLLFLLYVNDLPNSINFSSMFLFADDTKFVKSISCFNDSFQYKMILIPYWTGAEMETLIQP